MIKLSADAQANHERFIARAIDSEAVWVLEHEESIAYVDAGGDDEVALLFWSERAHAKRARKVMFKEYEVVELSLFEFVFKWLSGMADDEVLAGVIWTDDLTGLEVDPEQLQDDILKAMDQEVRDRYFDALQLALEAGEQDDA